MKITIDIPDRDYATMVSRAEAHGLKVNELIRHAIYSAVPNQRPFGADVILMVKAGYPDAVIAERFDVTNATVKRIRAKAGLPANKFKRSGTPEPPVLPGVSFTRTVAA